MSCFDILLKSRKSFFPKELKDYNLSGKNIIITGSSSGLGLGTAKVLAKMKANVWFACRDEDKTETKIYEMKGELKINYWKTKQRLTFMHCDLSDLKSIKKFCQKVNKHLEKVDILINNAGVGEVVNPKVSKQGIEIAFAINHLGHFYLTNLLIKLLIKSNARVINLTTCGHIFSSKEHVMEKPLVGKCENVSAWIKYLRSKLCNVVFTKSLQNRFDRYPKFKGGAFSVYPGFVDTNLFKKSGKVREILKSLSYWISSPPEVCALTCVYLACVKNIDDKKGKYFINCHERKYNSDCDDYVFQKWLWEKSEDLCCERFPDF